MPFISSKLIHTPGYILKCFRLQVHERLLYKKIPEHLNLPYA